MKVVSPLAAKTDVRMAAKTDVRMAILPNYKVAMGARRLSYILYIEGVYFHVKVIVNNHEI